ncbi:M23 family metallopeptidase [Microbacterium sp. SORGH_AS_0888]|uniref:M23 family metallopeptidase n=1 Tax=Microbacterium sp. SORGH_AS_0888 TaxID=3041791 RepID=UPI00277F6775|nr:M23 family metallopeptidase [Microbacterium sp. SORGH_AS_0888]MDQ1130687.1 murein DD-endopeptidase MepM/ murein hydrolase activator NlpD [Microbacterium sp. SORGH_AS_0888]
MPAAVQPPAVPLTRRQLREMAAREAERTEAHPVIAADTLVAPVVATAPIALPGAAAAAVADPEPVTVPESEFVDAVTADGSAVTDAFEAAAKLFAFTGETPVQVAAAAAAAEEPVAAPIAPEAPRRRLLGRGSSFRRATAASATIGAMGIIGLLAVGMTTPAEAVAAASGANSGGSIRLASDVRGAASGDIQAYVAPADAQSVALDRSDYSTASVASIAAQDGITYFSNFYTNNPNAAIQWPFAVGVSISYGFGMRDGGFHEGADFTPGEGAHVQAIAAGTVRIATESGGAYGVTVLIDHVIDGKLVSTRYAHMLYGSLQVKVGDTVVAGQYLGRTGDTGRSFGAHTHVEVLEGGTTPIDPIAWLRANAGRMSLGD